MLSPIFFDWVGVDEHVAVADLDAERSDVVRERIEGGATGQFELGVVPVAGQDPVLHGAATKREAHMGAAVVDRVDALLFGVE